MSGDAIARIMDANMNRAAEGLRLLEEVARLVLNDADLCQQLKDMRHHVLMGGAGFHDTLIQARDSAADIGADMEATGGEALVHASDLRDPLCRDSHGGEARRVGRMRRLQMSGICLEHHEAPDRVILRRIRPVVLLNDVLPQMSRQLPQ